VRNLALIALITLYACATAAAPDGMSEMAGVYTRQFRNGNVDGESYQSENRLEIVRADATHGALYVSLEFFNGHSCEVSGDARLEEADTLVMQLPAESDGLPGCTLVVSHEGDAMVFRDASHGCQMHYCGARGTFDGVRLPYASRRPLAHLSH